MDDRQAIIKLAEDVARWDEGIVRLMQKLLLLQAGAVAAVTIMALALICWLWLRLKRLERRVDEQLGTDLPADLTRDEREAILARRRGRT